LSARKIGNLSEVFVASSLAARPGPATGRNATNLAVWPSGQFSRRRFCKNRKLTELGRDVDVDFDLVEQLREIGWEICERRFPVLFRFSARHERQIKIAGKQQSAEFNANEFEVNLSGRGAGEEATFAGTKLSWKKKSGKRERRKGEKRRETNQEFFDADIKSAGGKSFFAPLAARGEPVFSPIGLKSGGGKLQGFCSRTQKIPRERPARFWLLRRPAAAKFFLGLKVCGFSENFSS